MTTDAPYELRIKELMAEIDALEKAIELQQVFRLEEARARLARLRKECDALFEQHESWWEERYGRAMPVADVVRDVVRGIAEDAK